MASGLARIHIFMLGLMGKEKVKKRNSNECHEKQALLLIQRNKRDVQTVETGYQ